MYQLLLTNTWGTLLQTGYIVWTGHWVIYGAVILDQLCEGRTIRRKHWRLEPRVGNPEGKLERVSHYSAAILVPFSGPPSKLHTTPRHLPTSYITSPAALKTDFPPQSVTGNWWAKRAYILVCTRFYIFVCCNQRCHPYHQCPTRDSKYTHVVGNWNVTIVASIICSNSHVDSLHSFQFSCTLWVCLTVL